MIKPWNKFWKAAFGSNKPQHEFNVGEIVDYADFTGQWQIDSMEFRDDGASGEWVYRAHNVDTGEGDTMREGLMSRVNKMQKANIVHNPY